MPAANDNTTPAADSATMYVRMLGECGFGPPLTHTTGPDEPIAWVATYLRAVANGVDPVHHAVLALRTLLQALPRGDLSRATPDLLANLEAAVEPAFHRLVLEAPRGVVPDTVALGMGSLQWMVQLLRDRRPRDELLKNTDGIGERLDWIALLADELDASDRRRRLGERGGRLARLVAFNASVHRTDTAGLPLH